MQIFDLKRFRCENKITQVELATLFECKQNFISRIENGEKPLPVDKLEILQLKYGDITEYFTDVSDLPQRKKVTLSDDSLNFVTAGGEAFSLHVVKMMNDRLIAPYGLLEEKEKQIEKLNRQMQDSSTNAIELLEKINELNAKIIVLMEEIKGKDCEIDELRRKLRSAHADASDSGVAAAG